MAPWLRNTLMIGGGLFALSLFDKARRMTRMLREKQLAEQPVNNIAGLPLPNPLVVEGARSSAAPVNSEATLANANPDTNYGEDYLG